MAESRSEAVRHTPGPWRVIDDVDPDTKQRNRLHQIWSAEEPIIYPDGRPGTSSILIARTCFAPNSEANARLIAAAPDMYEALLQCVAVLEANIESLPPGLSREALDDARAAVVKARCGSCGDAALAKAEGREAPTNA